MIWSKQVADLGWGRWARNFLLLCGLSVWIISGHAEQRHGVILLYHHVSSETPPSTSVHPEQFETHLYYLIKEGYQVVALEWMLNRLSRGEPVPPQAVAITFDDGYASVLNQAAPRLAARQMPFTVFVSTDQVGRGSAYLTWPQLRRVQDMGGVLADHGREHEPMALPREGETISMWRARVRAEIEAAQIALQENLGSAPLLLAYPYGEYSPALSNLVAEMGLYGLAQHSGAVGNKSDFGALSRHAFYVGAAGLTRLTERLQTLPLLVNVSPLSGHSTEADWLDVSVEVLPGDYDLGRLTCFFKGAPLEEIKVGAFSFQVGPLSPGRNVLICTAPRTGAPGYAWWSYLILNQ